MGPFGPLSNDSEYLTKKGWKQIDGYEAGDEIAQFNTATEEIEFITPSEYIISPCDSFYNFKGVYLDMMLSSKHRMLWKDDKGKYSVLLSEESALNHWNGIDDGEIPNLFKIGKNSGVGLSENELRLQVAVIAEGSFHKHNRVDNSTYNTNGCSVGFKKERKKLRLEYLLNSLGARYKKTDYEDGRSYYYFNAPIKIKKFDNRFWNSTDEQIKIIISELRNWDFHYCNGETFQYSTTEKESADFVQYCFHTQGIAVNITKRVRNDGIRKVVYRLNINISNKQNKLYKSPDSVSIVKYGDGFKYCFKTETGFFVARRNGKIFITGNSGKSSACVHEIIRRGHEQVPGPDGIRRSRWAVVRNCYDDQTEILTELRGWQLFKDLLPTDKVATLEGDNLVFKLPDGVLKYQYDGEMIGFEGESIDFLVTPEHKMWVSKRKTRKKIWDDYEIKTAEEIYGKELTRVRKDFQWVGEKGTLPIDLFEFLGFWFAEGSFGEYKYKGRNIPSKRLNLTQKKNVKYVEELLNKNGFIYRVDSKTDNNNCFTYHLEQNNVLINDLWYIFTTAGKGINRKIPPFLKNYPPEYLKAFIHGYFMGDGCNGQVIRLCTSSKKLADDLQEIVLKTGQVANIGLSDNIGKEVFINGRHGKVNAPCYRVTILSPKRHRPVLKLNIDHTNHLKGWYKKQYNGMVYCVNMPDIPVYVRRKGKGFWCLRSYLQLRDTTIKTFMDWYPERIFGTYRVTDHTYFITKFPGVEIEVLFRALDRPDQVSNLLSLELTGAWFNEVREVPSAIIVAMDGRINRYPSMRDGGPSWTGIIADTNPPDDDSYIYKMFEVVKPDNWEIFKQPSGLSSHAENTTHLPKNYYVNLAKGKDEMYIRIYIHGQYGYLVSGKPVFSGFVDNVHVAQSVLEPIKGLDLLIGLDFGLCYDDQTEVLTQSGWKFFKDVLQNDLVATKNFITDNLEYCKPSKRIGRPHNGDMYLYENTNVNFCVTPEHIIPCRKKYGHMGKEFRGEYRLSAKSLYEDTTTNYAVDLVADWIGNSTGTFGPLKWTSSVFAKFMGLYLSEGSCGRVHERINISQKKCDEVFQTILDDTGLIWHRGSSSWRASNKNLNQYLQKFGYSKEKYIPQEIKNMDKSDILSFIFTYTRGDGHIRTRLNGSEEHTIFTTSKKMADDFQELALKVGWYAKIRIVKAQDSIIFENEKPRLIHNEGGYSITFKKRAKKSRILKKYFKKIHYAGNVYCLTVPHGTLYVRRKLTPSWNGNTPACTIGQITPFGQLRILDELVSDGMAIRQFSLNQLLPLLRQKYFGYNIMGFGDPAGTARAPTDESTCFDILHSDEIGLSNITEAPTNAIVPRVNAVDRYLNTMVKGEPGFLLSPNCKYLRKALNGGYHYALEKSFRGGEQEAKMVPTKNFSSHVCDSLEYLCLYISEKQAYDKQKQAFLSQLKQQPHNSGSQIGGY